MPGMSVDVNNPYFRTKVMTASPEELRLMLIEGSIRFMREGRDALAERRWEASYEALTGAKNIILELTTSMRHEVAPDLCAKLDGLYTFMYRRLVDASLERDPAIIDEVISLMEYERETWVMLMDKVAEERGAETVPAGAPDAEGSGDGVPAGALGSISLEG